MLTDAKLAASGPGATGDEKVVSCRYDRSLALGTPKFLKLLKEKHDGVLDLNLATESLMVQNHRMYESINVLEGIGIIEKKRKNNARWRVQCDDSSHSGAETEPESTSLQLHLEQVAQEELMLDAQIIVLRAKLQEMTSGEKCSGYVHVVYNEIKSISKMRGDTQLAIKARWGWSSRYQIGIWG